MGVGRLPVPGLLLAMTTFAVLPRSRGVIVREPQDGGVVTSLSIHQPSRTSSYTETSTSPSPSSTGSGYLNVENVANTTVCGESSLAWYYIGDLSFNVNLDAKNQDTSSTYPISNLTNLSCSLCSYNWTPAAVPSGSYVIEAIVPASSETFISNTFYVLDSGDSSCLTSANPSATSSSDSTNTSSDDSSSSTSSVTGIPVVGAVSTSQLSGGGVAGVVVGAVVFLIGLIFAVLLLRRYRRRSALGAPRGGFFEKRRPKGAVAINSRGGSFSSTHGLPVLGSGLSPDGIPTYNLNNTLQGSRGRAISDESTRLQGEKIFVHTSTVTAVPTAVPSAVHRPSHIYRDSINSFVSGSTGGGTINHPRPSRHSSLMYTSDPFGSQPPTPSPRHSNDFNLIQDSQRHIPVTIFSRSESSLSHAFNSPGIPRDVSEAPSPEPGSYSSGMSSPMAVQSPVVSNRIPPPAPPSIGQSSSVKPTRRAKSASARKPVPAYSPSVSGEALELTEPISPRSTSSSQVKSIASSSYVISSAPGSKHQSGSSFGASSVGNDWSSAAAHSHSTPSGSYRPQSSTTALPSTLAGHSILNLPDLNHKSSFGERQMHVLIPDPPPREMQ